MAYNICKTDKSTGEKTFTSICCFSTHERQWKQLSKELGLTIVPSWGGLQVFEDTRTDLLIELNKMLQWLGSLTTKRIEEVAMEQTILQLVDVLRVTNLEEFDLMIG